MKIDGCLPGIFMAKHMHIVWWPLSSASLQCISGCGQASMKALQAQGVIFRGALPSADHPSLVLPPASVNLINSVWVTQLPDSQVLPVGPSDICEVGEEKCILSTEFRIESLFVHDEKSCHNLLSF